MSRDTGTRGRFILTESEFQRFAAAVAAGTLETIDARADGFADVDALGDASRIGERLADGFGMLHAGDGGTE